MADDENEKTMKRLESITEKFRKLKITVTEGKLPLDIVEEIIDEVNQSFVEYLEDWNFLAVELRQKYKCNYVGVQNDFHYVATAMLTHVTCDNELMDPMAEARQLENLSIQNVDAADQQRQIGDSTDQLGAAAQINFGQVSVEFPAHQQRQTDDSTGPLGAAAQIKFGQFSVEFSAETNQNVSSPDTTTKSTSTVATAVNESAARMGSVTMDTSENENIGPITVVVHDNPKDRAPTKPLEMPSENKKETQPKSADESVGKSITSLSFSDKMEMFESILKLQKVSKVDESNLNKYLVALTTVKEKFRHMRVQCDKETEHWIIMIILSTLDEASLKWWNLLMLTAQPVIEVLSEFLTTRVESLKIEAEDKPNKRSQSPGARNSAEKKARSNSRSRSRSRSGSSSRSWSRPTGTKPNTGPKYDRVAPQPPVASGSGQLQCRYCRNIGHVVANCPSFLKDKPEDRETNLFRKHLCTTCLLPHQKGDCKKANNVCPVCQKAHHPFLLHRR